MSVDTLLKGVRIIELADGVAGPMASCRLGDLAADVIKIEEGEGDWMRRSPPFLKDGRTSAVFYALNRGKRSLRLVGEPQDARILQTLLARSDILITDRSDTDLARLGLDEALSDKGNPKLIVARISAYGASGPLAGKAGSELCAQAMAGYTRYLGSAMQPSVRLGADVAGVSTAIFTTQAVLAALIERGRSGRGQRIDLSLLNSLLAMKTVHLAAQSDPDSFEGPRVGGAYDPPESGWATADAPVTFAFGGAVGANGRPGWTSFVKAVGLQYLLDDPRFDKNGRSTTGLGPKARELKGEYEKSFRRMPASEVVAQVRRFGGFASAYLTHRQLMAEPQARVAEVVVDAGGPADVLDFPAHFSDSRPSPRGTLSALGQHNDEIVKQLGLETIEARAG
ncbi:MAG: hypothetical protein BGN87_23165 [Rhizobiales bacterium 65-79]|jgi:crotonobetainyl-CoA:carnitine CoA-transferase CaiB-like acyl-CoA transferase|nr:CoA transferase [Hyphomicrobiales bacterium]OJU07169.1 MAG: hypothetical protein BGN87_23165 [Rhizobiales bacterium 65-79]